MAKINTFSLYLTKPGLVDFDDVLTENARKRLEAKTVHKRTSDNFGDAAALYIFPGLPVVPKWVTQVKPLFTVPDNLRSNTPSAIVVFKMDDSTFAVTFSFGHAYLDEEKFEPEFGLRVAINAISDSSLRGVERSNLAVAIRDFAQAASKTDFRSFGVDDALDLIRKVSGYAKDDDFAQLISGSRALRFSKKIDLVDVPETASDALKLFRSQAYKKTQFSIIDLLLPVLDSKLEDVLNSILVKAIRQKGDDFEIAIPEILPEAVSSFRFERAGFSDFYPDLSMNLYQEGLGDELAKLSIDDLKSHSVAAYYVDEDKPYKNWSVFRSLIGSLAHKNDRYVLNEGQWYALSNAFKQAADNNFARVLAQPDPKLRPLMQKAFQKKKGEKRQKVGYQSEKSYNQEVAVESGYLLMDEKLIPIQDVAGSRFEVCDLLDIPGRRFIHVKKSSRQSSILSHFFKQGSHSAQTFRQYESFKNGIIEKIKAEHGADMAKRFADAASKQWTVDFRIADFPRKNGKWNIPFFSKLTLREEARKIEGMGFRVQLGFIKLTAPKLKT